MKAFLRKNKLRLFLLGVPVLCLILLWSINFYKIFYELTPWKNLGSPPSQAFQIRYVRFPGAYFLTPGMHFTAYFDESEPTIDVVAMDGKVYSSDLQGQWSQAEYSYAPVYPSGKVHKWECAKKIEKEWGITQEEFLDATGVFIQGKCPRGSSPQYAVYQIRENGDIWGKYIDGETPKRLRNRLSFYICLFILLSALFWTELFNKIDPLRLKPDYEAN